MAGRSYERLPIEQFGRHLLDSGDLDPVYIALCRVEWDEGQRARFLVAYWCLYHVGLSCWLSDQGDEAFWRQLKEAAINERPSPVGGRWPRAAERRHWRGANALKSVEDLTRRYARAADMVDYLAGASLTAGENAQVHDGLEVIPYAVVARRVQEHSAFGPWIAFKVADMLERCCEVPVSFGQSNIMYEDPREAALRLFRQNVGAPEGSRIKDEEQAVGRVVEHLLKVFGDLDAPPGGGRKVGLQEVETILCKWKSHMNGHYPLNNDLHEIRDGALPWAQVSPAAVEFLHHLPLPTTPAPSA